MESTLFKNAALLDPARPELLEDHDVLVENGLVKEVSDRPLSAASARVIDLKGKTLMPGLIDLHVHVIAVQLNLPQQMAMPNVLVTFRSAPILRDMLRRGYTTVRDAGGAGHAFKVAVEQGLVQGPRLFVSGRALSQTGGHGDGRPRSDFMPGDSPCPCCVVGALARVADGVDEVRRAVRQELQMGADQIKIMASGGVASPTDPVGAWGYSEDEIRAIVAEARARQTYVLAHAYTAEAISRAVRCGVRTIEHGNLVDAEAARLMAGQGAYVVPTLITYEALANEARTWACRPTAWQGGAGAQRRPAFAGDLSRRGRADGLRHRPAGPVAPPAKRGIPPARRGVGRAGRDRQRHAGGARVLGMEGWASSRRAPAPTCWWWTAIRCATCPACWGRASTSRW